MKASSLLSISLLLSGAAWSQGGAESPPSPVAVERVERTAVVPTVPVTGTVYSRNEMQVTAGIDGQLLFVAEPGTRVEPGDVLIRMDPRPLELQLAEQQAAVERARAQLRYLDAQLDRQRNLSKANQVSATDLEQTESNRDVAASDLRIAQLRIQQTEDQLARSEVRARFPGVVTERLRREGETVARGTPIGRMTDTVNLEVRVLAPMQYAGRVRAGDDLELFGFESRHRGVVRTVVPPVDLRSQAFELRIDLSERALQDWTVGQMVSVAIPMRSAAASLAVPRDALVLRQDGTFVFRVNGNGKAERVAVQTGESTGDLIAVEGELEEGDTVVVRGAETLSEGRTVQILNAASRPVDEEVAAS